MRFSSNKGFWLKISLISVVKPTNLSGLNHAKLLTNRNCSFGLVLNGFAE